MTNLYVPVREGMSLQEVYEGFRYARRAFEGITPAEAQAWAKWDPFEDPESEA